MRQRPGTSTRSVFGCHRLLAGLRRAGAGVSGSHNAISSSDVSAGAFSRKPKPRSALGETNGRPRFFFHGWITLWLGAAAWLTPCPNLRAEIDVRIKTVDREAVAGRLIALSYRSGAILTIDNNQRKRIPFAEIVRLTADRVAPSTSPHDFVIELAGGDRLHGQLADGDGETVIVDTLDLGRIPLPLELLERIDSPRARQAAYRDSVEWLDRTGSTDEDRILLTNGDIVRGFITVVSVDGIAIESGLGETMVPHGTIVAARFAAPRSPSPNLPYQVLALRASGRLTVTNLDWSGDVVKVNAFGGSRIVIEAERIAGVEMFGGRWEWLSLHRPISYQHTPMLSMGWDYVRDRNVLGKPLTVAGKTYERGIGVHSRASLTFDLGGKYREFVSAFGIDDDSGPHADVAVSILVDGRQRFQQSHVRRGKLHDVVRLDVTEAKRIELIVDFGDNGDIQDRFNWIEPALIR